MNENYPIIVKNYNFTKWYIEKLAKLPRNHRFTLGEKIQNTLLELLMLLSDAIYSKNKTSLLTQANKELEKLRILSRLMKDLDLFPNDNYRFITNSMNEIGKMLGGWMRWVYAQIYNLENLYKASHNALKGRKRLKKVSLCVQIQNA